MMEAYAKQNLNVRTATRMYHKRRQSERKLFLWLMHRLRVIDTFVQAEAALNCIDNSPTTSVREIILDFVKR